MMAANETQQPKTYTIHVNENTFRATLEQLESDGSWWLCDGNWSELVADGGDQPTDEDVATIVEAFGGEVVVSVGKK